MTPWRAAEVLHELSPDTANLDFEGGLRLHQLLPESDVSQDADQLPQVISAYITATRPWWLKLLPRGRMRLCSALLPDELQCFHSAGLTGRNPDGWVVEWWDNLAELARSEQDSARLRIGREGEALTLQHEVTRLLGLGIKREPVWVSVDDNQAGYDILSFDPGEVGPVNRLIEVKATTRLPLIIHITRNEWDRAVKAQDVFYFYVWHLPSRSVRCVRAASLMKEVPIDQGLGRWESVEITLLSES